MKEKLNLILSISPHKNGSTAKQIKILNERIISLYESTINI